MAYQQDEHKLWTEIIQEVNEECARQEKGKEQQAQQIKELQAQNKEKEKALAKSKAQVREYQVTNKKLAEFLYQATSDQQS